MDSPVPEIAIYVTRIWRMTMSKYHSTPTTVNGIRFDSKREAERYRELMLLLRAGDITDLRLQPNLTIIEGWTKPNGERVKPEIYRADFSYILRGRRVYEDVKGTRTQVYQIKKKQVLDKFGIEIVEV